MKTLFFVALSATLALAVPTAIDKRDDCWVGSPNQGVIDTIYKTAKSRGVNSKVMLAMFETAAVESNYNNLDCGDQDSVGVFQQRPSQGWGTVSQIMDVQYSANKFLDGCIEMDKERPNLTTGQLAQAVQVSEFPDRYDEAESKARTYLNQAISRNGGSSSGGATNVGTNPSSSSPPPKTNTGSSSGSGSSSSGSSGCSKTSKAVKGDTCSKLASKGGIALSKFYSLNPKVNSQCTNLQIGVSYCIAGGSGSSSAAKPPASSSSSGSKASVPSNLASGTTKTCKTYYTVQKGDICSKLASKGGIPLSKLHSLNSGINGSCSNLVIGKAYCIAA